MIITADVTYTGKSFILHTDFDKNYLTKYSKAVFVTKGELDEHQTLKIVLLDGEELQKHEGTERHPVEHTHIARFDSITLIRCDDARYRFLHLLDGEYKCEISSNVITLKDFYAPLTQNDDIVVPDNYPFRKIDYIGDKEKIK